MAIKDQSFLCSPCLQIPHLKGVPRGFEDRLCGLPGRMGPYQEGNNSTEGNSSPGNISNGLLLGLAHAKL